MPFSPSMWWAPPWLWQFVPYLVVRDLWNTCVLLYLFLVTESFSLCAWVSMSYVAAAAVILLMCFFSLFFIAGTCALIVCK
jgi:hypothetical protein